ncbi:MAG: hypothetical protein KZQ83_18795 [gamma proteobacterium symbiont of Taylorina sp.]|nr:hypothetical protein [gamma proteobacterium symbiont of Taylorina sp.]
MGRTAQEQSLPKQRILFGHCNNCGADYFTAGGLLEVYDLINGEKKRLCHYCALGNWKEIKKQPNCTAY